MERTGNDDRSHQRPDEGPKPDIVERELKLLTRDGSPDPFYMAITPFLFKSKLWVHSTPSSRQLITSQRDTENLDLLAHGVTARLRTTSLDGTLDNHGGTDICIKIPLDKDGGLAREEFEAEQADFCAPDATALRRKYPSGTPENAQLHRFLDLVEGKELIEYFRIDVIRERHIIKIPNNECGLRADQAFYGELLYDRVRYVIDEEGMAEPIILNPHCELELEALNKPCAWNHVPNGESYVCKNLTKEDKIRALNWFRDLVLTDGRMKGHFVETFKGKAERGFDALFSYADFIAHKPQLMDGKIRAIFNHRTALQEKSASPLVIARPGDIALADTPVAVRPPRPPSNG